MEMDRQTQARRRNRMNVPEKLKALREVMKSEGIDLWIVPTNDYHESEYVGRHFMARDYLTGFTGSAGTAVVTKDEAFLWTDGRYFLQAGMELEGSTIGLMKIGEEGVPTIEAFVKEKLGPGMTLGFDGRCASSGRGNRFAKAAEVSGADCRVSSEGGPMDLVDQIWEDRPDLSCEPVWELDTVYAGESRADKIARVRKVMEAERCEYHVITSLDDIAWLTNLRGNDIPYNPVFLSYLVMTPENVLLFAQREAFSEDIIASLEKDHVQLRPYEDIYADVRNIPAGSRVLADSSRVNYTLWTLLAHTVRVDRVNPATRMKAVKNPVEMQHIRDVHVKDGVAVTRFIYWLKKQMKEYDPAHPVTETGAAKKLHSLRAEQEHFLDLSFETITGYGPHGAIIHYEPTAESDIPIEPRSFLLVDSGGQYLEGTTDITRTIACGPLTDEEKEFYTRILRGNLNLGGVKFRYGCTGVAFDYLARQPLWEIGMDYNHGTGHGVGFLLNVHEGPNSFSYKVMQGRPLPCVLEEGMVTSNEPGVYLEGKFGVRCENLTLCVKDEKTAYGQFMRLDALTLVPWEMEAVVPELLNEREKQLLNDYHAMVYEKISPFLAGEEKDWLREATRAI